LTLGYSTNITATLTGGIYWTY